MHLGYDIEVQQNTSVQTQTQNICTVLHLNREEKNVASFDLHVIHNDFIIEGTP